jgi:glyoxylase I family protein
MKRITAYMLITFLTFLSDTTFAQDALTYAKAGHVCIRVQDFDATIKWYTEKLNFKMVQQWKAPHIDSAATFAYISLNDFMIEVIGGGKVNNAILPAKTVLEEFTNFGYRHLCFDVDNVDAVHNQLKDKGVSILRAPGTNAVIQKKILLIQDNNGLVIEFAQDLRTSK